MKENKSQLKIGIILGYVNILIGNLIPIFYTPIMLELLGQSEYGLYKLASSAASYLSLVSFGIGAAVTRYLIKGRIEGGKEAEESVFGLFNIIFRAIAVVTCIVGCIIAFNLDVIYEQALTQAELRRMTTLVLILTANTAISFSASSYNAIVTSHERYVFLQFVNILSTCVVPMANLVALYLGFASVGMTMSSLLLNVFTRILYIVYVRRSLGLRPRYRNMPMHLLSEILAFSFWVFLGQVVSQLYNATDTLIIGAIPGLGTISVAIYNVGITFNNMIFSLAQAVSSMFTPRANKMVFAGEDNEKITDFVIRIGRYQCYIVALACSGFIAFGRQFITWYVGAEYLEAYWVSIATMLPACIPLVQSVALTVMQAKNQHQFRSIMYLVIAIANVIGTYLVSPTYGIIGAALITGICLVFGQGIAMNWYYWKRIGLNIPRFWKSIFQVVWIPVLLCAGTLFLGRYIDFTNIAIFFGGVLIYTSLYCLLQWRFCMTLDEKDRILGSLKRKLLNKE